MWDGTRGRHWRRGWKVCTVVSSVGTPMVENRRSGPITSRVRNMWGSPIVTSSNRNSIGMRISRYWGMGGIGSTMGRGSIGIHMVEVLMRGLGGCEQARLE